MRDTLTITFSSHGLYFWFPAKLTVITASPSPTALTFPLALTVTTDSSEEVKVISPASIGSNTATIISASPTNISKSSGPTLISVSYLETLTVTVSEEALYLLVPAKLTIIPALPSPTATTLPSLSTVTTSVLEEAYVSSPASSGSNSATIASLSPTYMSKKYSSILILVSNLETLTVTTARDGLYL